MSDLTVAPVYTQGQRVVAEAMPFAAVEPWYSGGPGAITRIVPLGIQHVGGDAWIYVRLDGTPEEVPYWPSQLKPEPTI